MNKWDDRFMRLAEEVATWSSCFKPDRHVGAVITKDKRILTQMGEGLKKIDGIQDVVRTDI